MRFASLAVFGGSLASCDALEKIPETFLALFSFQGARFSRQLTNTMVGIAAASKGDSVDARDVAARVDLAAAARGSLGVVFCHSLSTEFSGIKINCFSDRSLSCLSLKLDLSRSLRGFAIAAARTAAAKLADSRGWFRDCSRWTAAASCHVFFFTLIFFLVWLFVVRVGCSD